VLVSTAHTLAPGQQGLDERRFDLREGHGEGAQLKLVGEGADAYLFREPEGLRIKLPPREEKFPYMGITPRAGIQGDFEVTLSYQILQLPRAATGAGPKVNLCAQIQENSDLVSIERLNHSIQGDIVIARHGYTGADGKRVRAI
jgi:hypothetical protein